MTGPIAPSPNTRRAARAGLGVAVLAAALMLAVPPAFARAQDAAGTARARVIAPIAARPLADLDFGTVSVGTQAGQVTVAADGTGVRHSGGARSVCAGTSGCAGPHPAAFSISGAPESSYRVALSGPVRAQANVAGAPDLEIVELAIRSASLPDVAGRGRLDHSGMDRFTVGGTLLLPAGAVPARYRARIDVLVGYE